MFLSPQRRRHSPPPCLTRCHPNFPIFSSGASIPVIWRSKEIDLFLKTTTFWALLFVSRRCWHPMTREYYANKDRAKTSDCSSWRLQNTMAHLNIVEGADKSYFGEHFYSYYTAYVLLSYQIYALFFPAALQLEVTKLEHSFQKSEITFCEMSQFPAKKGMTENINLG